MLYSFAPLEADRLKAIQALEKEVGAPLVAMSAIKAEPVDMDEEKIAKIKKLEEELGVVLVAVQ
ncbi:hypothetical protein [Curvivirga aplysinae]|uniref:hypothetical protein n=1 Tax=Curvivirga aplysinae TaxID=2529852 RepID=UPI0012BD2AE0|nr:hypothetical protein [Curvivirga aplysinae]MTI10300.1 hypothetical protein [Curvivirga aplysinae]